MSLKAPLRIGPQLLFYCKKGPRLYFLLDKPKGPQRRWSFKSLKMTCVGEMSERLLIRVRASPCCPQSNKARSCTSFPLHLALSLLSQHGALPSTNTPSRGRGNRGTSDTREPMLSPAQGFSTRVSRHPGVP